MKAVFECVLRVYDDKGNEVAVLPVKTEPQVVERSGGCAATVHINRTFAFALPMSVTYIGNAS